MKCASHDSVISVKRCPNSGCVKVGMLQRDDVRAGGRVVDERQL